MNDRQMFRGESEILNIFDSKSLVEKKNTFDKFLSKNVE